MFSGVKFPTVAAKSAKDNMKKFTSPGLKNLTGSFHLLVAGVMALVVMTASVSRAQTIPSGYFQFTTANYTVSTTENNSPMDPGGSMNPSLLGARVTVTRLGGSSGRVLVPVVTTVVTNFLTTTIMITTNGVTITNVTTISTNVVAEVTNTLVFDDYQMSGSILFSPTLTGTNTILAGITNSAVPPYTNTFTNITASYMLIVHTQQLQTPVLDPLESLDLQPPALGPITNEMVETLNPFLSPSLTNAAAIIGFERSTFRIDKDKYTNAVIYVIRTSNATATSPDSGATVNYSIDPVINTYDIESGFPGNPEPGNTFALEAGSDYAVANSDFTPVSGTLTFPANVYQETITIPIMNNGAIEFNKDFQVALWIPAGASEPAVVGPVDTATVTILSDSYVAGQQPAGAVDRTWNADNEDGSLSSPPYLQYPGTDGGEVGTANGNGGTVYAVVEQTNDEAIIAGSFNSFDSNPYNYIARLLPNGYQDPTFLASPNSGANDVINAMVLQPDGRIIIGGNFTSFNGANRQHIARLNTDGSVDTTFNPGTGVKGQILSIALETNGQIVVAGDFSAVDGTNMNSVARLNANGSLDASFNPGVGPNGVINAVVVDALGRVIIGGDFDSVDGNNYGGVARLNVDGSLDTTFSSGIGTYNPNSGSTDPVYALAMQGSQILVGGSFAYMELANYNGLVRLNPDGTVDTTFNPGSDSNNGTFNPQTGLVDSIFAITLDPAGNILIGGDFTTYNQTRRVGIARLFSYGSLDTSFMDTAYNQFAGLINHYHNPNAVNTNDYPQGNQRNYVSSIAVEPTGSNNVIIAGNFLRVGGGSVFHSGIDMFPVSSGYYPLYPDDQGLTGIINSGVFANGRMDIHPRSNVARLIGGSTPGPGNITLVDSSYSVNKTAGTLYVSLTRTNGSLGVISANIAPEYGDVSNAGIANTNDVTGGSDPTWPTLYSLSPVNSWTVAPGFSGPNYTFDPEFTTKNGQPDVYFNIINNTNITGNLSAKIDLSAPDGSSFALGGESIPLGAALGSQDLSPLTIIDTVSTPGVVGFSASTYTVNQGSTATITLTRTNGTSGTVQINYSATNGTAVSPGNFTSVSGTLTFGAGVTSRSFTVPTVNGTSANGDKTVNLQLSTATGGATIGLTNAVLTIVNDNVNGHVAFTAPVYTYNENAGAAAITVSRLGGSVGTLNATVIVNGGTAVNGVNYIASTNVLQWNNGDLSVKTIYEPLIDDGVYTSNLTVNLVLTNGLLNTQPNANVLGLSSDTNSTLDIVNVDFPGTVEFGSGIYSVDKGAGFALIPVIRTGGSTGTLTVQYSTVNGTATNGTQYTSTNGTLTFANGQVAQYFSVPILDNGQPDGLTSLSLVLSNATLLNSSLPWNGLGSPSNAVLNIIDTDSINEPPGSTDGTYSSLAGFNGGVNALALQPNNQLVVGGDFTSADGVPRQNLARLNSDGTLDASFLLPSSSSGADNQVQALAIQTDGRIIVGGSFSNFNGVAQSAITRLNYDGSLDSTFNPGSGADNAVYALAESPVNNEILVGGAFATLNGVAFNGIGSLNSDGTPNVSFNPGGVGAGSTGTSSTVYALAVQSNGQIIIGGDFTSYNGVTVNHLARLNTDGSLDTNFNVGTGASDSVRAVTIQLDGKILIGGLFTNFNGVALNEIARLNTDGSVDSTFTPGVGANGLVSSIAVQPDGYIVVGGQFTSFSGVSRNGVTRLAPSGKMDPTINFGTGANGQVSAVTIEEDTVAGYPTNVPDPKIIIGGAFTEYDSQPAADIARIYGGSQSGVGAFGFSSSDYDVNANGLSALITVIRTGGTSGTNSDGSGDTYVPFATSNGTAVAGVNYQSVITNLDFPAGQVQETLEIPVINNDLINPDLIVNLALNPVPPAQYGEQPQAFLHIINVNSAVSFSSATYQVPQSVISGVATINISRIGSTNGTASVLFSTTTNGTAVAGTDYTPQTNVLVTFAPGSTNVALTIPIFNNSLAEENTTVGLALTNAVNTLLYAPSNATLTIVDTATSPGFLSFAATNYTAYESAGLVDLTVLRTNGTSGSVSFSYTTTPGTALPGVNYTAASGTVTLANGQTSGIIPITLPQNSLVQPPVTFSVSISNPTGGAELITPTNTTVSVISDNFGVDFLNATNYVSETNTDAYIAVQRIGNGTAPFNVSYATVNGSALAGVNYRASGGTLSFGSGQTVETIQVPLLNNNDTSNLMFSLVLSNATGGAQISLPTNSVVVLQPSQAGLSFTASTNSVSKNQDSILIAVVCSNPSIEPVPATNVAPMTVKFTTANGTATAGIDYVATNGVLYFTNGLATNYFAVPILNNSLVEGNVNFSVNLSSPTAPGKLVSPSTEVVTILDDNAGLSFSSPTYSVAKTNGAIAITVLRTGDTNTTSTINFATANGTAVAGQDYIATNGTFTFTNGQTSESFTVTVIGSTTVQPDKTVLLQLTDPVNGYLVAPSASTLTIYDNSGSLVVPAGSALVSESFTPPNGIIDPGETVTMLFGFRNGGSINVSDVSATLQASGGVTSPSGAQNYGNLITNGPSISRQFSFTASGTNSQQITATFQLLSGGNSIGTALFTYTLGTWTTTFYNTNPIVINPDGIASPYPSIITVTNVGGDILNTTVTLTNMNASSPHSVDVLVVSPAQQDALIMAHVGGQNTIKNVTLTFDDSMADILKYSLTNLTVSGQIYSGTNTSSANLPVPNFP